MKKLGKILVGLTAVAALVAGAYYFVTRFILKDSYKDFDDDFDNNFDDELDDFDDDDDEFVPVNMEKVDTEKSNVQD